MVIKNLIKPTYYLSEIRNIIVTNTDVYKIVFEINNIIKKWEENE